MASGIAHDFNNILTPIMGYTDLVMLDLEDNDPIFKDLTHVLNGARKARDLIEQILLFGKQNEKDKKPLRFQSLLKETLKLIRPTIPSTIEIISEIDEDCGYIEADSIQIHQVLMNLFTNAWQAMDAKGGTLSIELRSKDIKTEDLSNLPLLNVGEYICLTVKDTGIGIEEQVLEKVFDPFFTTKTIESGTGLGLFVVHNIIRNHKGDITVKSEIGKGTTFTVYLPVIKNGEEEIEIDYNEIIGGKEHILVLDDDEDVVEIIEKTLLKFGYQVDVFNNGIDAIESIKKDVNKYDLLLSDLTMPKMDGFSFAEKVNQIKPSLPIIIMTGYSKKTDLDTLNKYKIDKILSKPISLDQLMSSIREVLKK